MSKQLFNIGDKVQVVRWNQDIDSEWLVRRADFMPELLNQMVLIVDISNSHGLTYGVVKPNLAGSYGRKNELTVYWLDPTEVSYEY
jgi:hypothetical protein